MTASDRLLAIKAELREIASDSTSLLIRQADTLATEARALAEMTTAPPGVRQEAVLMARQLTANIASIRRILSQQ